MKKKASLKAPVLRSRSNKLVSVIRKKTQSHCRQVHGAVRQNRITLTVTRRQEDNKIKNVHIYCSQKVGDIRILKIITFTKRMS